MSQNDEVRKAFKALSGKTVFIRGQVDVEQHFDKFHKFEGYKALKEFCEYIYESAHNAQQARIDALELEIKALKEAKDVKGLDN